MRKTVSLMTISTLAAGLLCGCSAIPKAMKGAPAGKPVVDNAIVKPAPPPVPVSRRGPLTGILDGALAGGLVGRYADEETKDFARTVRDYGYTPAQGALIAFDSVRANPVIVAAGDVVNVNAEYSVLLPAAGQVVAVTETREFFKDGAPAGAVSIEIERTGGSYLTTIPFTVPGAAAAGNYQVNVRIEAQGGKLKDSKETYFKVTR
ncbi:MAG TPA: hypothetical protein VIU29_05380 [Candidatus Deferrimicrobiaceae bacterium]